MFNAFAFSIALVPINVGPKVKLNVPIYGHLVLILSMKSFMALTWLHATRTLEASSKPSLENKKVSTYS